MRAAVPWSLASLAVGAGLLLAACSGDETSSPTATDSPGAQIYAASCAGCHGADGSGGRAPAIGDGLAGAKYDRDAIVEIILEGKGAMPSIGLSSADAAVVADFVRDELGRPEPTTTEADDEGGDEGAAERGDLQGLPPELEEIGTAWPVANGDLAATRAVLDSPISSATIDQLEEVWTYEVPGGSTFGNLTTNPLVVGDRVYVGDLTTKVHAVDRSTGEQLFVAGDGASIFGPTGVGVGWGQLYGTKGDDEGRGTEVVAYDAETGEERWSTGIAANGGEVNFQPIAYDGLVLAATSGYGAGTRGTLYALDAETGAIVWDLPVIEDPDLWGNPDLNSGGGVWYPPTIDEERGLAYIGTGNPYPFPGAPGFPNGSSRPGPNRWTNSILAVDLDDGELVWGHQAIEHDIFDRDAMLTARVDVEIDGEERELAISTGKLGVVLGLDADSGEVVWRTEVGIHQNDELTEIDGPTQVYPGSLGGVQTPMAIAEGTIFLCVMNAPTTYEGPEETSFGFGVELGTDDSQLVALDAATGEIEWEVDLPGDAFGGATVLSDLVLTSSFAGEVLAFDRASGEEVWRYDAEGGINGWPAVAGDELYLPVGIGSPPRLVKLALPD